MDFRAYNEKAKSYFASIVHENDAIFDIGYNGRVELALTKLLGYPVNSYYIHKNSDNVNEKMKIAGFSSVSFYNFKPTITGVIREHIMMKQCGSTVGYDFETNQPNLGEYNADYSAKLMTSIVQKSAVKFTEDLLSNFGSEVIGWDFEYSDAVLPFEYFLHDSKKIDRGIFATLFFEDFLGEGKKFRAVDFWNEEINKYQLQKEKKLVAKELIVEGQKIGTNDVPIISIEDIKLNRKSQEKSGSVNMFLDKIESTDSQETMLLKCARNTSNLLDWNAIMQIANPVITKNWYMLNPGGLSEECKVILSTQLTWVEENNDLTYLDKVLDNIGDRVLLPINIGFSSRGDKKFTLSDESVNTLCRIAERCKSVGVKGEYSAEILNRYGIKNTRIVGTPSLFMNVNRLQKISVSDQAIDHVSASFRPIYGKFSEKEMMLLKYFNDKGFNLTDTTSLPLRKSNLTNEALFDEMKRYTDNRKIYFDIETWEKSFSAIDFSFGMNFSNNIMALYSGVPALFINYESTGKELCKLFNLPNIDIEKFDENKKIDEYYKLCDYKDFVNSLNSVYDDFKDFLQENDIQINCSLNKIIEK